MYIFPTGSPVEYIVERKDMHSGSWRELKSGLGVTSFCVSGLKPDKDYMFRVRAENSCGVSDPSSIVSYSVITGMEKY